MDCVKRDAVLRKDMIVPEISHLRIVITLLVIALLVRAMNCANTVKIRWVFAKNELKSEFETCANLYTAACGQALKVIT